MPFSEHQWAEIEAETRPPGLLSFTYHVKFDSRYHAAFHNDQSRSFELFGITSGDLSNAIIRVGENHNNATVRPRLTALFQRFLIDEALPVGESDAPLTPEGWVELAAEEKYDGVLSFLYHVDTDRTYESAFRSEPLRTIDLFGIDLDDAAQNRVIAVSQDQASPVIPGLTALFLQRLVAEVLREDPPPFW